MSGGWTGESDEGSRRERIAAWLLPIVVSLMLAGGVTWFAAQIRQQEEASLRRETSIVGQQAQRHLREWVDARLAVAAHFAESWNARYRGRPEEYRRDASLFLGRLPGVQALNWIDRDRVIRITVPDEGNEAALGADLRRHPAAEVRTAIERAVASGQPSRTAANVGFLQGGRGFAFYWAVLDDDGELEGFLNGVVRIDQIVAQALLGEQSTDRFRVSLRDGDEVVAQLGSGLSPAEASDGARWPFALSHQIPVLDRSWDLTIAPSAARLAEMRTIAGPAGLAVGYAVAGLIGWLLYLSLARQISLRRGQRDLRQLASAMDQASEGITVTDPQGRILYANRAFGEMMGVGGQALAGQRVPSMASTNGSDDALLSEIRSCLTEGRAWQGRYRTLWDDGSQHTRAGSVTPVRDESGKTIRLVCVLRDVSREEALEDQLRQGQKMEAVGRLAGGAAHDFNNLLTVISGYCAQILAAPEDVEATRESVRRVGEAAERAAELTRQLLAFSRQQALRPERLALDEVVEGLAPILRRLIGEDVEIRTDLSPDLATVWADRGQLEQVIVNLCLNARDAMPEGGVLQLSTGAERIGPAPPDVRPELSPGAYVALRVRDDGCGMPVSVRERMFDPFFTTKDVGKGTGLGLSTVYGIVEQSGGGLRVSSSPGIGTEFCVLLPASPAEASDEKVAARDRDEAAGHAAPPSGPSGRGELVLVVEDESAIRSLVARTLEGAGYRVVAARDGEEALARVAEADEPPSLLLSDVIMPRLGGPELRNRLREQMPGLRTLFMSGYSLDRMTGDDVLDPSDRMIQKPFSPSSLLESVQSALSQPNGDGP